MSGVGSGSISPVQALLYTNPQLVETLTPAERVVFSYLQDLWLRPEQRVPDSWAWRYYGYICGRGFGKTHAIACEINRRVMCGLVPIRETATVGLGAPTLDRVAEVQHASIIETAPPWFRPIETKGALRWPNGVTSESHSPEAPARPRSSNFAVSWMTEIVAWAEAPRLEFYYNFTTATRVGALPQVLWDTTSKGRNNVIEHLLKLQAADPKRYPIQRGAIYDNPMLARIYIESECAKHPPGSRKRGEELDGNVYTEAAGASYKQQWLDVGRVPDPPIWVVRICSLDPGLSLLPGSDPTGLVVGGVGVDGHGYLEKDLSALMPAEDYGDLIVRECVENNCAGAVVETNHVGNTARAVIKSRGELRGQRTVLIPKEDLQKPFPMRVPGTIFIQEITSRDDKGTRAAAPASETEKKHIHLIGEHTSLEHEMTSYEPGVGKSPNRFDAFNQLFTRLLLLDKPDDRDRRDEMRAAVDVAAELNRQLEQASRLARVGSL